MNELREQMTQRIVLEILISDSESSETKGIQYSNLQQTNVGPYLLRSRNVNSAIRN